MTRERYESLALQSLKEIAKKRGMKGISTLKKADLIDALLKKDEEDAARMLRSLSGRTHHVYTGVTLITPDGVRRTFVTRAARRGQLALPEITRKSHKTMVSLGIHVKGRGHAPTSA